MEIELDEDLLKYLFSKSITIKELIDILCKFPIDTKICITWESTINSLEKENIYMSKWGVVLLDADGNSYKEDYEMQIKGKIAD